MGKAGMDNHLYHLAFQVVHQNGEIAIYSYNSTSSEKDKLRAIALIWKCPQEILACRIFWLKT